MLLVQKHEPREFGAPSRLSDDRASPQASVAAAIARLIAHIGTFVGDAELAHDYLVQASALHCAGRSSQGRAMSEVSGVTRGGLAPWQTKRILSHVDLHISEAFSIAELAALISLSPSHFHRAFKCSLGVPPCTYIAARRIERACQLMIASNDPLAQIAIDCGMSDQSHLCRVFRRVMRQTPNAWRRQHFIGAPATARCRNL